MSACLHEVIQAAIDAGMLLSLNGGKINIRAHSQPPENLLNDLIAHKPGLIEYLQRNQVRQCWRVTLPDGRHFNQIRPGGVTYETALEKARKHWPDAKID